MRKLSGKMKIVMGVVLSVVVVATGVGVYFANSGNGSISSGAPRREKADISTENVISDEFVPLADDPNAAVARAAFDIMNQQRAAAGLGQLTWNQELCNCAGVRAKEAATTWAHTRPNGSAWYTVNSTIMGGENLARGYQTAQDAVNAWMASAAHKDNILFPDFTMAGIAIYDFNGYWYWAEEFGY